MAVRSRGKGKVKAECPPSVLVCLTAVQDSAAGADPSLGEWSRGILLFYLDIGNGV